MLLLVIALWTRLVVGDVVAEALQQELRERLEDLLGAEDFAGAAVVKEEMQERSRVEEAEKRDLVASCQEHETRLAALLTAGDYAGAAKVKESLHALRIGLKTL